MNLFHVQLQPMEDPAGCFERGILSANVGNLMAAQNWAQRHEEQQFIKSQKRNPFPWLNLRLKG